MQRNDLEQFTWGLGWSTQIYTLLTATVIVFSFITDAWSSNWVITILLSIAVIFFVEILTLSFHRHPRTWQTIRLIIILILIAFLLISMLSDF